MAKSTKPVSKKAATIKIYKTIMRRKNPVRADGIKKLISDVGLTPGAAATYWQNCKSGRWVA